MQAVCFAVGTLVHVDGAAQAIPRDESSFTKLVGERVARELPEFNVQPAGKLILEGKRADGESTGQIILDRVFNFCGNNAESCDSAIERYAKGIAEAVRERARPIERAMVRLSIRSAKYVTQVRQQAGTGSVSIFSRALTEDLAIVPVLDFTRTIRFVNQGDLGKLGLTDDEIYRLGEENLRKSLRPLSDVAKVPDANSLAQVTGEDYASSRILLHEDWKQMAATLNQRLVVMIPAPDVLLYGDGSTERGIDALRTIGMEIAKKSQRPLSSVVLRWTDAGWEQLK
jgi:uncharacterized protein YtpQ (UPF0354 family)